MSQNTQPEHETTNRQKSIVEEGRVYSHREILTVIWVLVLSILLAALDQTIVSTALPTIAGQLNGLNQISWLVTAYLLAQTIVMPIYGKIGDLYGRKKLLMYAVGIFLIGSVLSGVSQSMFQLIIFRALQGIGAGGLIVTAFSVIGDVILPRDRGKYLGYLMPIFGLTTVFGPALGGFFIDNFSWRWIFYINIPIGALAIYAAWHYLRLPPAPGGMHKIDYLGASTLGIAMICLVLFITWGGSAYPWNSAIIWGLGAAMIASLSLFIWAERRAHDPIFPTALFRNRTLATCMLLGITVGLGLFGSLTYLPTFLQIAQNASPTDSGLLMLPLSLGLFAAAITTGQAISRTGRYKSFLVTGTIMATIGMYLLSTITAQTTFLVLSVFMVILGAGIGMVMPVLTQVAQNAVHRTQIGVATSGVNLARQLSGAIGVALAGTFLTSRLASQLADHLLPSQLAKLKGGAVIDPNDIANLSPAIHDAVIQAFGTVLPSIFLLFVPILAIGIIIALSLKEIPFTTRQRP